MIFSPWRRSIPVDRPKVWSTVKSVNMLGQHAITGDSLAIAGPLVRGCAETPTHSADDLDATVRADALVDLSVRDQISAGPRCHGWRGWPRAMIGWLIAACLIVHTTLRKSTYRSTAIIAHLYEARLSAKREDTTKVTRKASL